MSTNLLEFGLRKELQIREERLTQKSNPCRLTYVSDIHLRHRRSHGLNLQVIRAVKQTAPDVILLGGDLVDQSSELGKLSELVRALCDLAPVLAVAGNHDENVGTELVQKAIVSAGGKWIHAGTEVIVHDRRPIAISGPDAKRECTQDGRTQILCAHNPRIWKSVKHLGYDLVLAGHLHGCQAVAFEFRNRLYPGAIFYPYCYLTHQRGSTKLVVSRGVSDLIPIRWRCPREVVLCYV